MTQEEYINLVASMNEASRLYYDGKPTQFTDEEWDKLMVSLYKYEEENPGKSSPLSPTLRVGDGSGENSVVHASKMLSLTDVFEYTELTKWMSRNLYHGEYCVEPKIDGLSLEVIYENGKLVSGSTRGDGEKGEDCLSACMLMPEIPKEIPFKGYLSVRHEVYLSRVRFQEYCREVAKASNERNLAVGLLKRKDNGVAAGKWLQVWAFDILKIENPDPNMEPLATHSEVIQFLGLQGFTVIESTVVTPDKVQDAVEEIRNRREDLPYAIDGAVIKINDLSERIKLGDNGACPRWAVAFKYPAHVATTTVVDIEYSVGKTGKINPVAILKTVPLCGTNVSRATLYNFHAMKSLDICIGDEVSLYKSGDIVPKITTAKHTPESRPFSLPTVCPCCGEALDFDVCRNELCMSRMEAILMYWVSKQGMNIENMGPRIVRRLIDSKLVKNPGDLYKLKLVDLCRKAKFTPDQATRIINAMAASKPKATWENFFRSLCIDDLGPKKSAVITNMTKNMKEVYEMTDSDFRLLFGLKCAESSYAALRSSLYLNILESLKPIFPRFF